jgi:hypothetical protein
MSGIRTKPEMSGIVTAGCGTTFRHTTFKWSTSAEWAVNCGLRLA